ncbi:MAG: DUF1810 family protein [Ilumatobacteraceae bacterium]
MAAVDLSRFVEPLQRDVGRAIAEIEAGRKRSHWIWYVLPQIDGLGTSSTARRCAIRSTAEARAFLADAQLGADYRRVVAAVLDRVRAGTTLTELFGWPDDAKTVSSLTLFAGVADADDPLVDQVDEILATDGRQRCAATVAFLSSCSGRS